MYNQNVLLCGTMAVLFLFVAALKTTICFLIFRTESVKYNENCGLKL